MKSIGEALRSERVRRHLDIPGVSRELKIPAKFLEAIEQEQFEKLPAAVFAKSFVRQYARYLGLQEEDLVNSLQRLLEPPPSITEPTGERVDTPSIQMERMAEWESVGERRSWSSSLPALALVVVAMLGCSGIYAWWQRNRHAVSAHEPTQSAGIGQEASSAAAPGTLPSPMAAGQPAPPPTTASSGSAQPAPMAASQKPAENTAPTQSAQPANQGTPAGASAAEPGPVHVEITASSTVWVSAKTDDKNAFVGTMEANQKQTFDAQHMITLRLGNPAGADIVLNGKSIGPIGPSGQPRTVQLTPGGFQIVASPKPSPDLLDPLR
jgi:cytoskeleton protein RodZ